MPIDILPEQINAEVSQQADLVVEVRPTTTEIHLTNNLTEIEVAINPQPEIIVTVAPQPEVIVATIHQGLPGKPGKDGGGSGQGLTYEDLAPGSYPINNPYVAGALGEDVLRVNMYESGFTTDVFVVLPDDFTKDYYQVLFNGYPGNGYGTTKSVYVGWSGTFFPFLPDILSDAQDNDNNRQYYKIPKRQQSFAVRRIPSPLLGGVAYIPTAESYWAITPDKVLHSSVKIPALDASLALEASVIHPFRRSIKTGTSPILIGVQTAYDNPVTILDYVDNPDTSPTDESWARPYINASFGAPFSDDYSLVVNSKSATATISQLKDYDTNQSLTMKNGVTGATIIIPYDFDPRVNYLYFTGPKTNIKMWVLPKISKPTSIGSTSADVVSYANPTYTTVAAALDALLNPYVYPDVTLSGGFVAESGSTVTSAALAYSVNKSCTLTINNGVGVVVSSPVALSGLSITTRTDYIITADDGTNTDTAQTTISFAHRRWFGPSSTVINAGTFSQATLNGYGLSSDLSDFKSKGSVTYNCTGGKYPYLIVWGANQAVTATVNGFPFTDFSKTNITIPDAGGVNQTYTCCKFNNLQNGTVTVVWS